MLVHIRLIFPDQITYISLSIVTMLVTLMVVTIHFLFTPVEHSKLSSVCGFRDYYMQ